METVTTNTAATKRKKSKKDLLTLATTTLEGKKARDLIQLKLPADAIADHLIICSATSDRHAAALAEAVTDAMKTIGEPPLTTDGAKNSSNWVIVDAGDFIVHIFASDETRQLYNLEKLWRSDFDEIPPEEETSRAS